MSTNKEPRSIRLTQAHRADIISAVMTQWEVTNPMPENGNFPQFITKLLPRLMKVPKNAPAEMKAFKHLVERTKNIKTVLDQLTTDNRDLINVSSEEDFQLHIKLESGENGAVHTFALPVEICDSLGIPYVGTTFIRYNHIEMWRDLVTVHQRGYDSADHIEVACFPRNKGTHCLPLSLPRDDKDYVEYTKAQREQRKWEEERSKVREEITDYLNQFNTTKQIRDAWPELVDYLPAHLADPERVIKLPAIARSRLNERLGLA